MLCLGYSEIKQPLRPNKALFPHTKDDEGGGRITIFTTEVSAEHERHAVSEMETF